MVGRGCYSASSHKQPANGRTLTANDLLQREIAATDRMIDQLVYQLYDLTDEEIKIVEGES